MDSELVSISSSRPSLARRRDKPQLSCHYCRRRKLRCDRQYPSCSNCAARDLDCRYAGQNQEAPPSHALNAQDRLAHLETLVTSLMSKSGHATLAETITSGSSVTTGVGVGSMTAHAADLPYVGGDHWAAILESIEGLKDQLQHEQPESSLCETDSISVDMRRGRNQRALLLYGSRLHISREEIIAALPSRNIVDRYLSCYFNRLGLAYYVVHAPSFLRQYQAFWDDPSDTPIMWIGLLFSMICLAVLASGAASNDQRDVGFYCEKVVQCLIIGEYTRAGQYALETMIHYIHIEFSQHADAGGDLWYLLGLIVNIAMRAGYHRDPSNFSSLNKTTTLLQKEMRRRLWASVLLGDVLISSQMGMPCMISESQWDTREPLNLADDFEDAEVEITKDSQSRPEVEYTHVLNIIAGRRIAVAVGAISAATNRSGLDYDQVIHLDKLLDAAGDKIPSVLKMKPIQESIADAPPVIMSRMFIAHLFHKGKLMLHRRYLYAPASRGEDDYSQKACVKSSLDVLDIQRVLHEETQSGGQLETMRWRVSSIMNHQFLIATMILCSMLHRRVNMSGEEEGKVKGALQRAMLIWAQTATTSREAARATEAIRIVLPNASNKRAEAPHVVSVGMEISADSATEEMEVLVDDLMSHDTMFDDWFSGK